MQPNVDPIRDTPFIGSTTPFESVVTPTDSNGEPLKLNELPQDTLREILDRLSELPSDYTTVNKKWYQAISAIYVRNGFNQINKFKEAVKLILPEIEKLDNENSKIVVDKLNKLISLKFNPIENRIDIDNLQKNFRREIIAILKTLEDNDLEKICEILFEKVEKTGGIPDSFTNYQLFAKLLLAAKIENEIENKEKTEFDEDENVFQYARFTNDEETLIRFQNSYSNENDYLNAIFCYMLTSENIDLISTALRMKKITDYELESHKSFKPSLIVKIAVETLLFNQKFNLAVRLANEFEQIEMKNLLEEYVKVLSERKNYTKVAEILVEKLNASPSDSEKRDFLFALLRFSLFSLINEDKAEDAFQIIKQLNLKILDKQTVRNFINQLREDISQAPENSQIKFTELLESDSATYKLAFTHDWIFDDVDYDIAPDTDYDDDYY